MENQKLSKETILMLKDLQDDINRMMNMESNIEVIWKMEQLQDEKAFQKSADYIRKSLAAKRQKSNQEEKETKFRLVHKSSYSFDGNIILSDGYLTREDALSDISHYEDRFTVELEIEEY
jgi:hypothetical protein